MNPKSLLHYLAAALLLGVYGGQVCPFLDSLTPWQFGLPLGLMFLLLLVIQPLIQRRLESAPPQDWPRLAFKTHLGLFFGASLILGTYNFVVHQFPLGSGAKLLLGFAFFGFFASLDLALDQMGRAARVLEAQGKQLELNQSFSSLPKKLAQVALSSSILIALILFLVINKDLEWLSVQNLERAQAGRSILGEFAFVLFVAILEILNLIHSYGKNLTLFLGNQTRILERVSGGDLGVQVPVVSQDEFGRIADYTNRMITGLRQATFELARTRDVTILSLANLAETRDNETGAHVLRTQRYIKALALNLAKDPEYSAQLGEDVIDLLFKSAPLHDIGKVGIPDAILHKPGKHTDEEFEVMKTHAALGALALEQAVKQLGENSFLGFAKEIALTHHEKWNGSGYPAGLKGLEIPLSGRLMALADVYDALISARVYKPAFSHEKAAQIITEGKGTHFDPQLIEAFLATEDEFKSIARQFGDQHTGG
ncbi:MAG: histidine kinase [Candidatus Lambdaproteobacteria bacterium RIFOXYD12_FULL_49_8]|uniref:Histidine kinase n=1 Tax=Candidatus Lambdaproteobacteria bacterium RIFOXYD2_FULL_50_16 TaxID=1817772 RepID=A0A1F6G4U0_9PROT|nr:MAG: histidine kinase [Candidatus Lambdaproteobacteria bacterium RIFOXYD2_FULL_50_16]OGG98340.1 MAG: histidine kinase [Candidatus Lambdaproteobacteria bacterium RIFOXYD12_FULL_49_8]